MVEALVRDLPRRPGDELIHLNLALSRDHAAIGAWHPGKVMRVLWYAVRAVALRWRHGCDTLYYVPAPGKRGALFRDWVLLAACRPFFRHVVLHWHASGLADWLETHATAMERWLSQRLLGRADLALVVAPSLRRDADYFQARRVAVVPNGVPDPGEPAARPAPAPPFQALFLGRCSEDKGLFAAAAAVKAANRRAGCPADRPRFTLVAAGAFPDRATADRFAALARLDPAALRHAGFAPPEQQPLLWAASHCLVLPTRYPAEGLPLVILEALAHDRPVLATQWRGLADAVTADCGILVSPGDADALVRGLEALQENPPAPGACRRHYLAGFTLDRHLQNVAAALQQLEATT
jgi:glycosyltransferase involved in cell wall biosynthesis